MSLGYFINSLSPIGSPHPNPLPDVSNSCTNGTPWVWDVFHECVQNNVQYAGFFLGLLSILCWLVVFLPQFYDAYKTGKMDEGISFSFLFCWFLGDLSNLIGSLLSNQLGTQIAVAYYYMFADGVILMQFMYYYIKNRRKRQRELRVSYDSMAKTQRNQVIYCFGGLMLLVTSTTWFSLSPWQWTAMHDGSRSVGRTLLSIEAEPSIICKVPFLKTNECFFYNDKEIIGYVCGCVSAIFYLLSRAPQLYKNYKRKSVEGLALMMFVLTVLGNILYGLSIILENQSLIFLLRHMPWIVGSLGTLCFDSVMLIQFRLYGRKATGYVDGDETRGLLTPHKRSDDDLFRNPSSIND